MKKVCFLIGGGPFARLLVKFDAPLGAPPKDRLMKKPECVFSEAVRVSTDELLTELLRRLPEDQVTAALTAACNNAQQRTARKRHIRYKCQRFFRRMTERFGTVPDDLAVAVGLKERQLTLAIPPASIADGPVPTTFETAKEEEFEPEPTDNEPETLNEYEAALERMRLDEKPMGSVIDAVSPKGSDEFFATFDVPGLEDFKSVFDQYPYAQVVTRPGYDHPLLVLGYASGKNKTGDLVRRNLALNEVMFNDLTSIFGRFRRNHGEIHQHIKVVTYRPGTLLRSWTNVRGVGDRLDQSRYMVCDTTGLRFISWKEYHELLEGMRRQASN